MVVTEMANSEEFKDYRSHFNYIYNNIGIKTEVAKCVNALYKARMVRGDIRRDNILVSEKTGQHRILPFDFDRRGRPERCDILLTLIVSPYDGLRVRWMRAYN